MQSLANSALANRFSIIWNFTKNRNLKDGSEFSIRQLAEGLYQLNFILQQPDRRTRRTTLWRKNADAWQIVLHQGTIIT